MDALMERPTAATWGPWTPVRIVHTRPVRPHLHHGRAHRAAYRGDLGPMDARPDRPYAPGSSPPPPWTRSWSGLPRRPGAHGRPSGSSIRARFVPTSTMDAPIERPTAATWGPWTPVRIVHTRPVRPHLHHGRAHGAAYRGDLGPMDARPDRPYAPGSSPPPPWTRPWSGLRRRPGTHGRPSGSSIGARFVPISAMDTPMEPPTAAPW